MYLFAILFYIIISVNVKKNPLEFIVQFIFKPFLIKKFSPKPI